jgi:hypothetical protein
LMMGLVLVLVLDMVDGFVLVVVLDFSSCLVLSLDMVL